MIHGNGFMAQTRMNHMLRTSRICEDWIVLGIILWKMSAFSLRTSKNPLTQVRVLMSGTTQIKKNRDNSGHWTVKDDKKHGWFYRANFPQVSRLCQICLPQKWQAIGWGTEYPLVGILVKYLQKMKGTLVFHFHSCGASKKYEALWSYHPPRSAEKGSLAGNPSFLPFLFPSK